MPGAVSAAQAASWLAQSSQATLSWLSLHAKFGFLRRAPLVPHGHGHQDHGSHVNQARLHFAMRAGLCAACARFKPGRSSGAVGKAEAGRAEAGRVTRTTGRIAAVAGAARVAGVATASDGRAPAPKTVGTKTKGAGTATAAGARRTGRSGKNQSKVAEQPSVFLENVVLGCMMAYAAYSFCFAGFREPAAAARDSSDRSRTPIARTARLEP